MTAKPVNVAKVAEDIHLVIFEESDTTRDIFDKFYEIMRKHGLKRCVEEGGKVYFDNPMWQMSWGFFLTRIYDHFDAVGTLLSAPEDLMTP